MIGTFWVFLVWSLVSLILLGVGVWLTVRARRQIDLAQATVQIARDTVTTCTRQLDAT